MRTCALWGWVILIAILGFTGCGNLLGDEESENKDGALFMDSRPVISTQVLSSDQAVSPNTARSATRSAADESNKVYFRSSNIEFWQVDSVADISSIKSAASYELGGSDIEQYQNGKSLAFSLGDDQESIAFYPNRDSSKVLGAGLNDGWNGEVAAFKAAGKDTINLVRLDIGNGLITFILAGERRRVLHSDGSNADSLLEELEAEIEYVETHRNQDGSYTNEAGTTFPKEAVDAFLAEKRDVLTNFSGIDANSIVFIDKALLSQPVLVDRPTHSAFQESNSLQAEGIVLQNPAAYAPLEAFLDNADIDANGALFIPFDPVDFSAFDPAINNLVFSVNWNIAGAIERRGDAYFMADRLQKTALDFSVAVTVE